jgi:hypothetical protein
MAPRLSTTRITQGHLRSVSVVIKSVATGDSLEQFLFETRYMDMKKLRDEAAKDVEWVVVLFFWR